jgi:dTDP-4-dehydrorhamnose 3,5-epimerase
MKITPVLTDAFYIENDIYKDNRGYFFTPYKKNDFIDGFVQDNESFSMLGVLRGLHYQKPPYSQSKLVRVIRGRVLDVIVDIRSDSPTFGQSYSIILDEDNKHQLYVPRGYAHGFLSLEDETIVQYKVDNYYNPKFESGIYYKDPDLKIDWELFNENLILSEKDKILPSFKETVFYTKSEHQLNIE